MLSAAILIAAEVFGAAFAGGWAFGNLFGLGDYGTWALQIAFFILGLIVMTSSSATACASSRSRRAQ